MLLLSEPVQWVNAALINIEEECNPKYSFRSKVSRRIHQTLGQRSCGQMLKEIIVHDRSKDQSSNQLRSDNFQCWKTTCFNLYKFSTKIWSFQSHNNAIYKIYIFVVLVLLLFKILNKKIQSTNFWICLCQVHVWYCLWVYPFLRAYCTCCCTFLNVKAGRKIWDLNHIYQLIVSVCDERNLRNLVIGLNLSTSFFMKSCFMRMQSTMCPCAKSSSDGKSYICWKE